VKRTMVVVWVVCVLVVISLAAFATSEGVLDELELVDWTDLPGGTSWYSGGVATAVVMDWYAQQGYPGLVPDVDRDGSINRGDVIALASDLGWRMAADLEPIVDPLLVDVLARHVISVYPDEFLLRIYDPSFPQEFHAQMGHAFDPLGYPGLDIEIAAEPTHDDVVFWLENQTPGIAGVGMRGGDNRFAVTRSFSCMGTDEGRPLDLVNTDPYRFEDGRVWNTVLRFQGGLWEFACPAWIPFETLIVLIPLQAEMTVAHSDHEDGESGSESGGSIPPDFGEPSSAPGGGQTSGSDSDRSADLQIEMKFDTPVAVGTRTRYLLYLWNNGPDAAQNVAIRVKYPSEVRYLDSAPVADTGSLSMSQNQTLTIWRMDSFAVTPESVVGQLGAEICALHVEFDPSLCGSTVALEYGIASDTPDPDLQNNSGSLQVSVLPCDPPAPAPPAGKPNLWVTNVSGCWRWSQGGDERVIATVTGVVHNGGQATASNVRARVTAAGRSRTVAVGTIAAGGRKSISATIDIGPYDSVGWPFPTSITADPFDQIDEADESNNTTASSIPEGAECG